MSIVRTEDAAEMLKVSFSDLGDSFLCGVLVTKAGSSGAAEEISATLELGDLFASHAIDQAKRDGVTTVSVAIDDPLTAMVKTAFGALFGEDESIASSGSKPEPIGSYYSGRIENWLRILRDGDSIVTPTIEEFSRVDTDALGVGIYSVRFRRSKLLAGFKANLVDYVYFQDEAYKKLLAVTDMSTPAIAVGKQLDFLRASLQARSASTGETRFSFTLKSFNFRRSIMEFDGAGGQAMMLAPLSPDVGVKTALPFLLNVKGELDLEQVKIVTPIHAIDDVDIQYSIHRPAVANVFGATYCALSPEDRARMSPVEVQAYEQVVRALQENLCFLKRPDLEDQFTRFAVWAVKSVVYCLEEPTFLKESAQRWADSHRDDGYQRMEDDFFLPFVYERLREKFGALVSKKPERFGGNVDILFGEIPVELKVRKGQRDALVDAVVDEKYKPTGQAAAYAALTRLGCVLVLDVPTGTPVVTNLSACIKVVRRDFAEAEHPTAVVVFVFHCNSPRPSSAI
jgi:hypothetical protein